MNFLDETRETIAAAGKKVSDIEFIGSQDGEYECSWEQFCTMADVEYNSGFGAAHVAIDLVIVFTDGSWLERYEYDGAEDWEYKSTPKRRGRASPLKGVVAPHVLWPSVKDLSAEETSS